MSQPTGVALAPPPKKEVRKAPDTAALQALVKRRREQQQFRSLTVYAKLLGASFGVQVVEDPNQRTAATDGKTVWHRPCNIGDEKDAKLLKGLIGHECAVHVRQTDFEALNRLLVSPAITKSLQNVFEDVWGERESAKKFPGVASDINEAITILVERGVFSAPTEQTPIPALLVGGLVTGLRAFKLGQTQLLDFHQLRWAMLKEHLPVDLVDRIWLEAQRVDDCRDTNAAIDLAEKIVEIIREGLDIPPPPPPPPPSAGEPSDSNNEDGESGDDGEPQGGNGSGNAGDQSTGNSGSGNQASDDGKPQDGNDSGNAGDQSTGNSGSGSQGSDDAEPQDGNGSGNAGDQSTGNSGSGNQASDDGKPQDGNGSGNACDQSTGNSGSGNRSSDDAEPQDGNGSGNAGDQSTGNSGSGNQASDDGKPQDGNGSGNAGDQSTGNSGSGNRASDDGKPQDGNDSGNAGDQSTGNSGSGNRSSDDDKAGSVGNTPSKVRRPGKKKSEPQQSNKGENGDPTDSSSNDPTAGPEQAAINTNGRGAVTADGTEGDAAPQPAPMTPEQHQAAMKALAGILAASQEEAGSGELADALSQGIQQSTAPARARALGVGAGNTWELGSARMCKNPELDSAIQAIARPIAVRLGSKLDSLLEAQTTNQCTLKRQGRRLDSRALVRIVTAGDSRVFRVSDDIEQIDIAVHTLTDISGSMSAELGKTTVLTRPSTPAKRPASGWDHKSNPNPAQKSEEKSLKDQLQQSVTRIGASAAISRAVGDVLERFNVPFALSYFGERLTHIMDYDDSWRAKRDSYWERLEGSTCTDQALIGVIPRLAARQETRKLLMLVTDGAPAHAQGAALVLGEAQRHGIEVCVVMVTSDKPEETAYLKEFIDQLTIWEIPFVLATQVETLAQSVFEAIKKAL